MTKTQNSKLTKTQKRLLAEVADIAELCVVDYDNILDYDPEDRTVRLELMKRQLAVSKVVWEYTYVDELLGGVICHFFFGKKKDFPKLWKTRKFKTFNYFVLEVLSLTEKLRLVKSIQKIPKSLAADIETLNALRNGLAHAYFPENLRSYKPVYKGMDIYSRDGLQRFIDDMRKVTRYFWEVNFGLRPSTHASHELAARAALATPLESTLTQ
jgi:hypothetical protein